MPKTAYFFISSHFFFLMSTQLLYTFCREYLEFVFIYLYTKMSDCYQVILEKWKSRREKIFIRKKKCRKWYHVNAVVTILCARTCIAYNSTLWMSLGYCYTTKRCFGIFFFQHSAQNLFLNTWVPAFPTLPCPLPPPSPLKQFLIVGNTKEITFHHLYQCKQPGSEKIASNESA